MLKAIGKFIDTLPLRNLLSLEEVNSDTIVIEVDRFHDTLDLSAFTFVMRGVSPSASEALSELEKEISEDGNFLHLTWHISSLFTAEPGTLFLDLLAYRYNAETTSENPPDYLLRYQLPAVEIRDIPKASGEASDTESYTAFWIGVKEQLSILQESVSIQNQNIQESINTQNQNIQEVSSAVDAQDTEIKNVQNAASELAERIRSILTAIGEHTTRLEELRGRIDILVMSQEEYDQLEEYDDRILYVLT